MFKTKFVEKIKTHFVFFFFFENHAIYEMKWQNGVESDNPLMTKWLMLIACWIPKATNTHSDKVILESYVYWTVHHCDD